MRTELLGDAGLVEGGELPARGSLPQFYRELRAQMALQGCPEPRERAGPLNHCIHWSLPRAVLGRAYVTLSSDPSEKGNSRVELSCEPHSRQLKEQQVGCPVHPSTASFVL